MYKKVKKTQLKQKNHICIVTNANIKGIDVAYGIDFKDIREK